MTKVKISSGVVHNLPTDLQIAINSSVIVKATWEDITTLARNEWICWVTSGKKTESIPLNYLKNK